MRYFTDTAVRAATLAGQSLIRGFRKQNVLSERNRSTCRGVLSSCDHAGQLIIGSITEHCPAHNLYSEESGLIENGSSFTWIVNPLNGKRNFLNHNPFFAVSICLAYNNEPVTGVIFSPFLQEMIVARKGQGCTLNGQRMKVSTTRKLSDSYVVSSSGGRKNNLRFTELGYALNTQVDDLRKIGSAAIECYMVAAGRADGFATLDTSSWDVAAGILAAQEAGGTVSDFDGKPWTLEKSDVLISNGLVHDDILAEINRAGVTRNSLKMVGAV